MKILLAALSAFALASVSSSMKI